MVAQHRARIGLAENAAPLQFRHNQIDKIVQPVGSLRRHDVVAVRALLLDPTTQSILDVDQIGVLCDELLAANARWLPLFQQQAGR